MRLPALTLVVVALAAQALPAQQQPPAAPPANPQQAQALDRHLVRWEQEMQKIQTLAAIINRTEKDKAFNSETKLSGFAQYMKSGGGPTAMNLAMMEMR